MFNKTAIAMALPVAVFSLGLALGHPGEVQAATEME